MRQTTNHGKGLQRYRVSQKKSIIKMFSSDIITGEFIKALGGGGATRYKWSKFKKNIVDFFGNPVHPKPYFEHIEMIYSFKGQGKPKLYYYQT